MRDDPLSPNLEAEPPHLALSVRQPWAWAIFNGKDVENRTAQAVNSGKMEPRRICIHAAKGMTRDEYEHSREFMASIGVECPAPAKLVRGAILGTVDVAAIVKEHASKWFFGPRGLVLEDPFLWSEPCPCVGSLGFFELGEEGGYPIRGQIDQPKPWMTNWSPDGEPPILSRRAARRPKPLPLFGESA